MFIKDQSINFLRLQIFAQIVRFSVTGVLLLCTQSYVRTAAIFSVTLFSAGDAYDIKLKACNDDNGCDSTCRRGDRIVAGPFSERQNVDGTIMRVGCTFVESAVAVIVSEIPVSLKARRLTTDYT